MSERLIILGTGGTAYDIVQIVEAINAIAPTWEIAGFLDDAKPRGAKFLNYEILGPLAAAASFSDCKFILAIGSDRSFRDRPALVARTCLPRENFATLIHPRASVSRLATLGNGIHIGPGVSVSGTAVIDDHVALWPLCAIGHDVRIGAFTVIAPGACVSGFANIGKSCYLGARCAVRQRTTVGDTALVGMGAVVVDNVAPGQTVVGNPARPLIKSASGSGAGPNLPRVDVIVPCYKYAHYLTDCVKSVLTQRDVDARVLIIDDASPDNTAEVAAELERSDRRVEFRRHIINHGHIATFNEGIAWASGDFLLLLSADDRLLPGALSRAAKIFADHPKVGLVHGAAVVCEDPDKTTEPINTSDEFKIVEGRQFVRTFCGGGLNLVQTPTVVVRTHLQKELGGYRRELLHTGDMEMWMRFAVHGDIAETVAHQAFYRLHGNNMSTRYRSYSDLKERRFAIESLLKAYAEKIPDCQQLHDEMIQVPSREAFYSANEYFEKCNAVECRRGLEVALEINPEIARSSAYRRLELKMRLGPKVWSWLRRATHMFHKPEPVSL
jgi:sugar O-acyltransferase (sialic acid O-acetyltransferase NeuD family)